MDLLTIVFALFGGYCLILFIVPVLNLLAPNKEDQ